MTQEASSRLSMHRDVSVTDEYVNSTLTPGDPNAYTRWYDLAFYPYTNGTVAIIANGKFKMDNGEPNLSTYQRTAAREFAYDDPRARWLARELNPSRLAPTTVQSWTDYLGVMPWSDFDLELNGSQPVATEQRRYLATAAEQDAAGPRYLHGDVIDSTVMTTNASGVPVATLAYTAFGEPIGDSNALGTRYRCAGAWGYESGFVTLVGANLNLAPIMLQHVGARWYQPDIGRFAQRDPTGTQNELNLYAYALNAPANRIDPDGLSSMMRPDALIVQIQSTLAGGGTVSIALKDGRIINVYKVVAVFEGGRWQARFWYFENGVRRHWNWAWQKGSEVCVDIVKTSSQIGVSFPGSGGGACGASGLEAAPLVAIYLLVQRGRLKLRGEYVAGFRHDS